MADGSNVTSAREKRVRTVVSSKPSATKRSIRGDQSANTQQGDNTRAMRNKTNRRVLNLRFTVVLCIHKCVDSWRFESLMDTDFCNFDAAFL
jgi:hypothetical protein